jgi:hypothetical protein
MRVRDLATLVTLTVLVCVLFAVADATAEKKAVRLDGQVRSLNFFKSVPGQLNYQGFLSDAGDSSAVTATLEMTFRLFDSETKGAELWSETHPSVEVSKGLFQVLLGSVTAFPADLFDGTMLWLQTEVGLEILSPRKSIVSVAYSQKADDADQATTAQWASDAQHAVLADTATYTQVAGMTAADSATVAGNAHQLEGESLSDLDNRYAGQDDLDHLDAADGDPADAVYVDDGGQVGIGTTSPTRALDVNGDVNAAFYYGDGSNLTGISGTTDNDWTISGSDMYSSVSGNVGVGTSSPAAKFDVGGAVNTDSYYQIDGNTILSVPDSVNTIVGVGAGGSKTDQKAGYYETLVGYHAGSHNQADYNTFVGGEAGYENTTGALNTFVGAVAGSSNTTGNANTFVGGGAGQSNTTGIYNTFLGSGAGYENTIGLSNTFIGRSAGQSNTEGTLNTFVGEGAGEHNTTGVSNTFIGRSAGNSNLDGNANTFLGLQAGGDNTTGSANTFLGYAAGRSNTTGTHNVFIGYKAGYNETGSDKLYIANDEVDSRVIIYGDFSTRNVGIGTTSPGYRLQVGESGDGTEARANGWNTFSSREYKKDISPLQPKDYERVLKRLGELDVVQYHYKGDAEDRKLRTGLIAEDAPEEMTSEDGKAMSLSDSIGFLLAAIKAQQKEIGSLKEEIGVLRSQLQNQ